MSTVCTSADLAPPRAGSHTAVPQTPAASAQPRGPPGTPPPPRHQELQLPPAPRHTRLELLSRQRGRRRRGGGPPPRVDGGRHVGWQDAASAQLIADHARPPAREGQALRVGRRVVPHGGPAAVARARRGAQGGLLAALDLAEARAGYARARNSFESRLSFASSRSAGQVEAHKAHVATRGAGRQPSGVELVGVGWGMGYASVRRVRRGK